jgi:hypothetical protein
MSKQFENLSTGHIAMFLENTLPESKEMEVVANVITIEDLWALAEMSLTLSKNKTHKSSKYKH